MLLRIVLILFIWGICIFSQELPAEYRLDTQFPERTMDDYSIHTLTFTVYHNNDNLYSVIKDIPYGYSYPAAYVLENGGLVIIDDFNCELVFYDSAGHLLNNVSLIKDAEPLHTRSILCSIRNDRAVILLSDPSLANSILYIFNNTGDLLLSKNITGKYSRGLSAFDNSFIAVSTYDWNNSEIINNSAFYNFQGENIFTLETGFTKGIFSSNGNIFLGFTNEQIFAADLINKQISFTKIFQNGKVILDAEWEDNNILILTSDNPGFVNGKWIYSILELSEFDYSKAEVKLNKTYAGKYEMPEIISQNNKPKIKANSQIIEIK